MATTWILVADRSGARILGHTGPESGFYLVEEIEHPAGRLRSGDFLTERPGRVHDRMGDQRHAVSNEDDPVEHAVAAFARDLAGRLRQAQLDGRYDRLVLVAGPKLLGKLRDSLDKHVVVAATLDKDLAGVPLVELERHLSGLMHPATGKA